MSPTLRSEPVIIAGTDVLTAGVIEAHCDGMTIATRAGADRRVIAGPRYRGEVRVTRAGIGLGLHGQGDVRFRGAFDKLGSAKGVRCEGDGALFFGREPLLLAREEVLGPRGDRGLAPWYRWSGMVGADEATLLFWQALAQAADGHAPVWLHGETGTGKERAARTLHELGPRASGPFVALNCAALPENLIEAELFGVSRGAYTGADKDRPGAFQKAHGGTLLLDEVGELSAATQAKLLRALELGEVTRVGGARLERADVRVVAASWRDLEVEAAAGSFRHDLLHRLWVLRVDLLPLRARTEDIEPLVLARLHERDALHLAPEPALLARLRTQPWRGNVRELLNQVERAIAYDDPRCLLPVGAGIPLEPLLPKRNRWQTRVGSAVGEAARSEILRQLQRVKGNRTRAARALGVSRSTLYRWLAEAGLEEAPRP